MLELKNISRTYTPKKGVPVQALKEVNLSFEDRGMVFVLGKSGSGKSTLLNLIGGLDFADSGEIIIDGKSSKDFKQADYDSYRNTYIGFVFQEYNILNEFTVGENISLALELQSQKGDKQRLDEILKEVDLEGYADRKPNELSGGQKQRVAIARAIIKNPKIIMADEPTGALDSETGKSIFDTLKRLSQDRLVIVVSHDRDFAEQYGDRIIELADGEVISDEIKNAQDSVNNENKENTQKVELKKSRLPYKRALAMGGKSMRTKPIRLAITILLCIISFAFFGLADTMASYNTSKATIKSIMANNYDTLAITSGMGAVSGDVTYLKETTGIDFDGVATFEGVAQELPLIYNRKVKGNKGLDVYYNASISGYLPADKIIDGDKYKLIAGRMPNAVNEIVVSKYTYEQLSLGGIRLVEDGETKYIEPEEISNLQDFVNKAYFQLPLQDDVVTWKVVGVVDTLEDPQDRYAQLKPNAKRDEMSAEKYEMLSAECMQYFSLSYHSLGYVTQQAYEQICNIRNDKSLLGVSANGSLTFNIKNEKYTNSFKHVADDTALANLDIVWTDGVARNTLKGNEFVIGSNMLDKVGQSISNYTSVQIDKKYFDGIVDFSSMNFTVGSLKDFSGMYIGCCEYAEGADDTSINKFKEFINSISDGTDEEYNQMLRAVAMNLCFDSVPNVRGDYNIDYYSPLSDLQWRLLYAGYLMIENLDFQGMIDDIDGGYVTNAVQGDLCGKQIQEQYGLSLYNHYLARLINDKTFDKVGLTFVYGEAVEWSVSAKIVGVYMDDNSSDTDSYVINNDVYEYAQMAITPEYAFLIAPMTRDKQVVKTLTDLQYGNGEKVYSMQNSVMLAMDRKNDSFTQMGKIFLYVGIGLAVFSVVLMSNYISVSISSQKRQIGILRALGARSSDVFAIFYSESLIIAIVNFVLATLGAFITSIALNAKIAGGLGLQITFMIFGIRQIALILALSIGISLIASILSIYAITKRKPVDCILDK